MRYRDDGSNGVFVEEIFPHIELAVSKSGNSNFELDNKIASIALLVDDATLTYNVLCVFACHHSFPIDFYFAAI